jgi:probable HAF family extracellular repeat protein
MEMTFTTLDFPGAAWTQANGISRGGPLGRSVHIVGRYLEGIFTHGFLFSGGEFTALDVPHGYNTAAYGINGRGQIVGTYESADGRTESFEYESGTYTQFSLCESVGARSVFGINNAGSVVGSSRPATPRVGFEYDAVRDQCEPAAKPSGKDGYDLELFGINDSGRCVGSLAGPENGGSPAVGISFETILDVPAEVVAPNATTTVLRGVSDRGFVCGYADNHAFIIDASGAFTVFDHPDAVTTVAYGLVDPIPELAAVNAGFEVVGFYRPSGGETEFHGFVATMTPRSDVREAEVEAREEVRAVED